MTKSRQLSISNSANQIRKFASFQSFYLQPHYKPHLKTNQFYSDLASEWQWGWRWPCFDTDLKVFFYLWWPVHIWNKNQRCLYQSKVTSGRTYTKKLGNWAHNWPIKQKMSVHMQELEFIIIFFALLKNIYYYIKVHYKEKNIGKINYTSSEKKMCVVTKVAKAFELVTATDN